LEFFVTMDNDENVKFEVDNNESVYTFYDVDGEKKEVQNGKLENTDTELNALNYIEIIESLKDLPEGELTTEDDLYVLTYNVLEFFVMMDNDENVKFEVDNNESVYTFYDVDGEKKEVQNGKLENTDTELNALNYIEIIESLKDLPEGELTTEDDLYVLTYNVL